MALRNYKPYTKSMRGTILVDRSNLWKGKPEKTLTKKINQKKYRKNLQSECNKDQHFEFKR